MARMPHVKLVEGSETDLPEGEPVGSILPPDAIAAQVDGELRDLSFVPTVDATVDAVLASDDDGLHVLRHSTAHVMAQASATCTPGRSTPSARRSRTASTTTSSCPRRSRPTTCRAIEARMREIVAADAAVRPRGDRPRGGARAFRRPAVQGGDHRGPRRSPRSSAEVGGGDAVTRVPQRRSGPTCVSARTCPPPAGWARSA